MGWEILVIPIIGVAVWIISALIRGSEQAKREEPTGRKRPEKVTDLDRFLREIQRRRESAEREDEKEPRVERRRPEPRPARRRPPEEEEIPVVIPVEPVAVVQTVALAPVLRSIEAPPLPVLPAEPLPAPQPRPRRESAAPAGLRELLRSRDGVRKAMILREVLGPPLARRRPVPLPYTTSSAVPSPRPPA
jgi:hypothetical protein